MIDKIAETLKTQDLHSLPPRLLAYEAYEARAKEILLAIFPPGTKPAMMVEIERFWTPKHRGQSSPACYSDAGTIDPFSDKILFFHFCRINDDNRFINIDDPEDHPNFRGLDATGKYAVFTQEANDEQRP